jgi:hypothetical protein
MQIKMKTMKVTFWSNVAISTDLAELCFQDYQELGRKRYQKQSMVDNIGEWAARSGNEKVITWALQNDFYIIETGDQLDVFVEATENGHIKILELTVRKELDWYNQKFLVGAVARTDLELLDFILNKKPTKFTLSFTRMCAREGFVVVMEWWEQMEST